MRQVYRCGQIDGHLTVPPMYGGRLDENGNSILDDDGRQDNKPYGREWDDRAKEYLADHRRKVDHMDNLEVRQAREDMATPEQALAELQAAEREMYWKTDKDKVHKVDNALQECRDRLDNATSEDEALDALRDYEAALYLKGDR